MDFRIFYQKHIPMIIEFVVLTLFLIVLLKVMDCIDEWLKKVIDERRTYKKLLRFMPIFNRLLKAIIIFFFLAMVLESHGYSITSLLAGFGIAGLAVGFAAKETIANIFGSIAVLGDNVYDVEDYIVVGDVEGTVEEINLRSTKIRTSENSLIVIPNNIVANSIVTNVSAIQYRLFDETFGLVYETSVDKIKQAEEIIKSVLIECGEITTARPIYVNVNALDSSSINIRAIASINYPDIANYRRVRGEILTEVLSRFRQAGIDFAFNSQTIYLKNEN